MRRFALAIAVLVVMAGSLTACGKEKAQTDDAAGFSCSTQDTSSFAIPEFAANVGLIVGTFHHWIYKPYKAGTFQKGAKGRTFALVKAAGIAALDYNRLQAAVRDAQRSKTLCPIIGAPLAKVQDQFSNLKSAILHGDFSSLALIEGGLGSITGLMGKNGAPVTESAN